MGYIHQKGEVPMEGNMKHLFDFIGTTALVTGVTSMQ